VGDLDSSSVNVTKFEMDNVTELENEGVTPSTAVAEVVNRLEREGDWVKDRETVCE
jgi:hypothetical protein